MFISLEEFFDVVFYLSEGVEEFFVCDVFDIVFGVLDGNLHVGDKGEDLLFYLIDLFGQNPRKLADSGVCGKVCLCGNDVADSFRLREVDTSVEECPFCKFSAIFLSAIKEGSKQIQRWQ